MFRFVVISINVPFYDADVDNAADLKTSSTTVSRVPEKCDNNTGIAIKNRENESFNSLLAYDSDSSSSSSSEIMRLNLKWKARVEAEDSDDSTSSSQSLSNVEESEVSESDSSDTENELTSSVPLPPEENKGAIKKEPVPKIKNEMSYDDLPPVPDLSKLSIDVANETFVVMGEIVGIIDRLGECLYLFIIFLKLLF